MNNVYFIYKVASMKLAYKRIKSYFYMTNLVLFHFE